MPLSTVPLAGKLDCWTGGFDVPELVLSMTESGRTGRLELESAESEKKLFLENGKIVFASSSSPDERLGAYLLLRNELALSDLRRLSSEVRESVRLGRLLVEHGLLGPEALVRAVTGQVRAIVIGLFNWSRASYRFVEEAPLRREPITLAVPPARWIIDGIDTISSWRRVSRGMGAADARWVSVDGREESLREIDLDTASLELLALLRHPRAVEEICAASQLPDIDVCRRLWAFRLLGFIRAACDDSDPSLDSDLEGLGMILSEEPPVEQ